MFRRAASFLCGTVLLLATPMLQAQPTDQIDRLRLGSGRYNGAYTLMVNDLRVDWYFVNLGLIPVCQNRPGHTAQYLDLYLRQASPRDRTIERVWNYRTGEQIRSDSDDSYAATMISLAVRHVRVNRDQKWWTANRRTIKDIADKVLLSSQKPSGLVSNFVGSTGVGYLQDNCEVYRALDDLGRHLASEKDPDAGRYTEAARRVAAGIAGLFDETKGCFSVADIPGDDKFYPYRTGQVFPQIFEVPLGDPEETRRKYKAAYAFLNESHGDWTNGRINDGSLGGFPHMDLGYGAALQGDTRRAEAQLRYFKSGRTPQFTGIHEIGWALRIEEELSRVPESRTRGASKRTQPND